MSEIHPSEVMRKLRTFVEECGSQHLAASVFGVSPQYLSKVILGQREIGPRLLGKLHIRRTVRKVVTYAAQ